MQICFRCNDSTNVLLDKYAHTYGISKNQLINHMVQEYLGQVSSPSKTLSLASTHKEILTQLRQANRTLAELLADTNDFYFHFQSRQTPPESEESLRLFRTELVGRLADLSDRLDRIRTDIHSVMPKS